ncbi:MAG: cytochrome c oxidase assembly protein [Ilumatobacteraceae bacterium]|jgi:putative membrane protein|nr:cytochrome c oxidase assembly protein [Ilumatobacteraceae bacterium]
MIAEAANPLLDPWRFQAHPEIWLLIVFLIGAYTYAVKVIGPQAGVPKDQTLSRKNLIAFIGAIGLLWFSTDWPMHDISEEYLYSVHMFQHMVLAYFVPPLVLLAIPEWLFRAVIGEGKAYRFVKRLSTPIVAGLLFNVVVMITHIPGLVNRSAESSPLHYAMHILVVSTALCMWSPICSPAKEFQIGYAGKTIYLFLMSVVPTVPAAWLTFAEDSVYKHYDIPIRVWGLSTETDQQLAGAVMKTGGSLFLWAIVIFIFFKRLAKGFYKDQSYVPEEEAPLTFSEVEKAFSQSPAPKG